MFTSPDAQSVGNSPVDTGWDEFSKATPRVVQPYIKRALEKRIQHIEAANAARIWKIEKLEAEVDSLYRAYREEHFSLQELRHALEFGGRANGQN